MAECLGVGTLDLSHLDLWQLHGDAPALHGGEALRQRQAQGADHVPGALHHVGLGDVGTHGGG